MNHLINIILIGILLISSCQQHSDPTFEPYVHNFIEEASKRGLQIEGEVAISFGQVQDGKSGSSKQTILGDNIVTIDQRQWQLQNQYERSFLIYHELGHALLNRPHENTVLPTGQCKSLMHEAIDIDCSCDKYSTQWFEYYLDELFLSSSHDPVVQTLELERDSLLVSQSSTKHFTKGYEEWGYIGDSREFESHHLLEIQVNYSELPQRGITHSHLEWNGLKVTYDHLGSKELKIWSDHSEQLRTYYKNHLPNLPFPIEFKFVKLDNTVYCLLNGTVIHMLDYSLFRLGNRIMTAQGMKEYDYKISISTIKSPPYE